MEVTTEAQFDNTDDLDSFTAEFYGQKEAEPTASVTPTTSEEQVEEAQEPEATANEAKPAEPVEQKKTAVQTRIDELVKQREDVKREAEQRLEAQKRDYEARLAALGKPAVKEVGEPGIDDKMDDGSDKYPLGEFDPKYIRDLTRYTLDYERKQADVRYQAESQQRQAEQYRSELQVGWQGKLVDATKELPDLVEKGQQLISRFNDLDPAYSQYLSDTLMEMEHGPQVLYYLSNNPEEATSIINSGAKKATLALGRIESQFQDQSTPKGKVTKAPPPPPVRARGTNGAFISVAPDTDDLKAFEAEFFRRN